MTMTWSTTENHADITLSNGNLTATATNNSGRTVKADASAKKLWGRHVFEVTFSAVDMSSTYYCPRIGIAPSTYDVNQATPVMGNSPNTWAVYPQDVGSWLIRCGNVEYASQGAGIGAAVAGTVMVAVDLDARKMWYCGPGGSWESGADPATGVKPHYESFSGAYPLPASIADFVPAVTVTSLLTATVNFGDTAFVHSVPSGYSAWSSSDGIPIIPVASVAVQPVVSLHNRTFL